MSIIINIFLISITYGIYIYFSRWIEDNNNDHTTLSRFLGVSIYFTIEIILSNVFSIEYYNSLSLILALILWIGYLVFKIIWLKKYLWYIQDGVINMAIVYFILVNFTIQNTISDFRYDESLLNIFLLEGSIFMLSSSVIYIYYANTKKYLFRFLYTTIVLSILELQYIYDWFFFQRTIWSTYGLLFLVNIFIAFFIIFCLKRK